MSLPFNSKLLKEFDNSRVRGFLTRQVIGEYCHICEAAIVISIASEFVQNLRAKTT